MNPRLFITSPLAHLPESAEGQRFALDLSDPGLANHLVRQAFEIAGEEQDGEAAGRNRVTASAKRILHVLRLLELHADWSGGEMCVAEIPG